MVFRENQPVYISFVKKAFVNGIKLLIDGYNGNIK